MKHSKILILMLLCVLGICAKAQNTFNNPFSQHSLGFVETPDKLPMVSRLGGVSLSSHGNNYINPFNPASYGDIEKESFVLDMGLELQITTLRHDGNKMRDADGNIGYLMVGMPVTKWLKIAGGLLPYSTVEYETIEQKQVQGGNVARTVYDGTGGVNHLFIGAAVNILQNRADKKRLQVGFNINYFTGRIERAISYSFPGNDSTYFINSRKYKTTSVHYPTIDFGVLYEQPLSEKYTLGLSLAFKPHISQDVKDMALIYTYHSTDESLIDTIFPARGDNETFYSVIEQSQTIGVGLRLERNKRWAIATDITFAPWQGLKYTENQEHAIFGTSTLLSDTYQRYAIGIEKVGDMDATRYIGRMSLSIGAHFQKGIMYLSAQNGNTSLNEYGIGGGITMPMRKGKSLLGISVNYSVLGENSILQRNALTIGINVSSCERWFVKKKYN